MNKGNSAVRLDCPGCGAVMKAKPGEAVVCPYCGRKLTAPMPEKPIQAPPGTPVKLTPEKTKKVMRMAIAITVTVVIMTILLAYFIVKLNVRPAVSRSSKAAVTVTGGSYGELY